MTPSFAAPPVAAHHRACCARPGPTEVHCAHQCAAVRCTPATSAPTLTRRERPDRHRPHRGGDRRDHRVRTALGYLELWRHVQQAGRSHSKCGFCTGCFTGKYPVAPPTETMDIVYDKPLSHLRRIRSCNIRRRQHSAIFPPLCSLCEADGAHAPEGESAAATRFPSM